VTILRHPRRTVAATALPLALLAFGALAPSADAIVGGRTATSIAPSDGSFARIDSPRRSGHVCGATLIAPRWAITAGHCTGQVDTKTSLGGRGETKIALSGSPVGWTVRFGSRRNDAGGRVVKVKRFVRASRTIAPEGDFALLELRRAVRATPAKLATRPPATGAAAFLQGWGYTGRGGLRDYERTRSYPAVLRVATTLISSLKTCGLEPRRRALCVGVDERTGPDNMDSGGPVFVDQRGRGRVLAGTVNGGNYVSGLRPAIYTDLSAHRAWIDAYTSGRRTIPGAPRPASPGIAGTATILPSGCSASVVRVAASRPSDPAMLLTNGHCLTPRPAVGGALADRPAAHPVALNGATSNVVARATTTRLLYATMTGTDVALYRLRESYATLAALGVPARELATQGPVPGTKLTLQSGALQNTYSCTVGSLVPAVREAGYTQRDVVRYATDPRCAPVGGTSGAQLVDARTGQVVAVHNSHVAGDAKPCAEGEPCEIAANGTTSAVKGRGYAQPISGLTACLDAGSTFDAARPGCAVAVAGRP
jgi:hypothetical protein